LKNGGWRGGAKWNGKKCEAEKTLKKKRGGGKGKRAKKNVGVSWKLISRDIIG